MDDASTDDSKTLPSRNSRDLAERFKVAPSQLSTKILSKYIKGGAFFSRCGNAASSAAFVTARTLYLSQVQTAENMKRTLYCLQLVSIRDQKPFHRTGRAACHWSLSFHSECEGKQHRARCQLRTCSKQERGYGTCWTLLGSLFQTCASSVLSSLPGLFTSLFQTAENIKRTLYCLQLVSFTVRDERPFHQTGRAAWHSVSATIAQSEMLLDSHLPLLAVTVSQSTRNNIIFSKIGIDEI